MFEVNDHGLLDVLNIVSKEDFHVRFLAQPQTNYLYYSINQSIGWRDSSYTGHFVHKTFRTQGKIGHFVHNENRTFRTLNKNGHFVH